VLLKKLALLGFKSFPSATEIEFGPGMTGIVGPNGCGKTNVLDALRWVLGEQRTSALRSGKMEEVIFNGSRDAKPLGMSEVSVTIANSRGVLPTQYTDVTITRRLYRSGESEYRLNMQPCRLRDILDLFADTGMGAHSYSVIQQDMIDAILSEKAEERRFLFDEAAGVTKYKHRKKAALRKLEATEADLLRLKDIAAEVRTRVISLKRQSSKAERYAELKAEWEQLHLRLAKSEYDALKERAQTQSTRAANLRADMEAARGQVLTRESGRESFLARSEDAERIVDRAREELTDYDQRLHQLETEWEKTAALAQGMSARQGELVHDLGLLAGQRRDRERQIEDLGRAIQEAEAESAAAQTEAERQNAHREQAEAEWHAARTAYARAKEEAQEAQERFRGLEQEQSHAAATMEDLHGALAEAYNTLERATALAADAAANRTREEKTEEEARTVAVTAETALKQARRERDFAQAEYDRAEAALKVSQAALAERKSQAQVLASWIQSYSGYHGAVPTLLTQNRLPGIEDTVAELIRPRDGYQLAVAAALGERAEYLVCSTHEAARTILRRLEETDIGRAHLIVVDALGEAALPRVPAANLSPVVELVTVPSGHQKLLNFLLGDFFLWTGPGDPDPESLPSDLAVVTSTGRIYRGRAEVAAGRPAAASLLVRKDELARLEQDIASQRAQVEEAGRGAARAARTLAELREKAAREENRLMQSQEAYRAASLSAERARATALALEGDVSRRTESKASIEARMTDWNARLEGGVGSSEEAQALFSTRNQTALSLERMLEAAEGARTDALLKSGEAQVRAVSARARCEGLTSDRERTREMLQEIQIRVAATVATLLDTGQKRALASGKLRELAAERAGLSSERVLRQKRYNAAREELAEIQVAAHEQDAFVRAARKQLDLISANFHEAEMASSEARLEVSNLAERVRETGGVDLEELTGLEPVEPNQRGVLKGEVHERRDRLDKMGTVNLLALEEYREQKERLDFLDAQLADMAAAKHTLLETIEKINQTANSLFVTTFDKVQANFTGLFTNLFEGGEAKVALDVPEDPLESAISISARPRGKRPVSILQLSGGERALTAIALLFSLYMVKPSPFCILDEIDAPLDDANIGRFLSIIQRFSAQTQFIVITHNKMTMQATDALYGVTMESPGISKVVSVKLSEAVEVAHA